MYNDNETVEMSLRRYDDLKEDIKKFQQLFDGVGLKWEYNDNYNLLISNTEKDLADIEIVVRNEDAETIYFAFDEANGKFKGFTVVE